MSAFDQDRLDVCLSDVRKAGERIRLATLESRAAVKEMAEAVKRLDEVVTDNHRPR